MRILRTIGTHLLTAVLTAAVVSLYWYGLSGSGTSAGPRLEPRAETAEKNLTLTHGRAQKQRSYVSLFSVECS